MEMLKLLNDIGLIEFVEGTLDRKRAAILEERLKTDTRLAAEVEELRQVAARLRESALSDATVKSRLHGNAPTIWPRVEARIQPRQAAAFTLGPRFAMAGGAAAVIIAAACWLSFKPAPQLEHGANNSPMPSAPSTAASNSAPDRSQAAFVPTPDSLPFREGPGVGKDSAISTPRMTHIASAYTPSDANDNASSAGASITIPNVKSSLANPHLDGTGILSGRYIAIDRLPASALNAGLGSPPHTSAWRESARVVLTASLPARSTVAWPDVIQDPGYGMTPLADLAHPAKADTSSGPTENHIGRIAVAVAPTGSVASYPVQVAAVPVQTVTGVVNVAPESVVYDPDDSGSGGPLTDEPLVPTPGPHISFGANGQGDLDAQTQKAIPVPEIPYLWTKALAAVGDQAVFDGWRDALEASANSMVTQDPASSDQIDQTLNVISNSWKLDTLSDKIYQECITDPDIACWRIMGHVYELQNDPADAVYAWSKATQTGLAGSEDWYQLGRADEQTQDFAGARAAYGQVLASGRSHPDLATVIEDAEQRLDALPDK
jgi:hypothetical protein